MTRRGVAVVVILALVGLGCRTVRESPPDIPVVLPTPPPASPPDDPQGQGACDVVDAVRDRLSADPVEMAAAGEAGAASTNPDVAANSRKLADIARNAVEIRKGGDELLIARSRVELSNQMYEVWRACKAGQYLG